MQTLYDVDLSRESVAPGPISQPASIEQPPSKTDDLGLSQREAEPISRVGAPPQIDIERAEAETGVSRHGHGAYQKRIIDGRDTIEKIDRGRTVLVPNGVG